MGAQSYEPFRADSGAHAADAASEASHVRSTHPLGHLLNEGARPSDSQIVATSNRETLPAAAARFGRYEVLGRVAVGGMAEIFFARESSAGGGVRHLGLKLLKRRAQTNDEDSAYFEELFQREGRTAMLLAHPNICHVYEFGKVEDRFFIAMEWISGRSLRDVIDRLAARSERLSPALAAGIATQVADALHYAHDVRDARGRTLDVVHRDVNPQNVMLRFDGSVQLLDFGVAHVNEPQQDTRAGAVKGKLSYMAPEQLIAGGPIDRRADVFALGVCLYEMLSGERLYKRSTVRETLKAVLTEPTPSLQSGPVAVPAALDQLLQRALEKRPNDRFQTAGELQDALEGFLAQSREVASRRRIAELMQGLFPGQSDDLQPALDATPEVMAHVTLPSGELHTRVPAAPPTSRARRSRLALAALAGVLVFGGFWLAWNAGRARPALVPVAGAVQPAASAPQMVVPPAPPAQASEALTAAPAAVTPPAAEPSSKGRSRDGRSSRRRKAPAFVAEPGF